MKMTTKELCLQGLLIALVTVFTMVIQIPVSATNGYIHLGDSVILVTGVLFGKRYGAAAGGLGSALADLLSGYAHWALFSLVIKGIMGYLAGAVASGCTQKHFFTVRNLFGVVLAEVWMIVGYLLAGTLLYGSFATALTSVPENAVQAVGGIIVFLVLGSACYRAKLNQLVSSRS